MDGYPQAKQVLTHKRAKTAGLPYLTQLQTAGIISGLALGYLFNSILLGAICTLSLVTGLAVYQGELIVFRLWYSGQALFWQWMGYSTIISLPASDPTRTSNVHKQRQATDEQT